MISRLSISNYILITELEIQFDSGLNIVTGETGAGKSILMDALGLLAGERADPKALRNPEKKCTIEAWFLGFSAGLKLFLESNQLDFEDENIIRREILPGGKSRAFINDSPVTLDILKQVAYLLFDIHGQQDTRLLGSAEIQFESLDILAGTTDLQQKFAEVFQQWRTAAKSLETARNRSRNEIAEIEFKGFIWNELSAAALVEGEQEELESRLELQKNAGDIKSRLAQATEALDGSQDIVSVVKNMSNILAKVASYAPALESVSQRLSSVHLELKDIAAEIGNLDAELEIDPRQMQVDEERLSKIYALQKKHGLNSISELIAMQNELDEFLRASVLNEDGIALLEKELARLHSLVETSAEHLHASRLEKVDGISAEIQSLLTEMAMPNARFLIELKPSGLGPFGLANIRFLFSANPGLALADMKSAASGGEFSRLMLAFKCLLASRAEMPSLIFDEIDTGISGEVAMRVGKLIKAMATRHQVLVITHSAQMASRADAHFLVEKVQTENQTNTLVRRLNPEEQISEIAGMISGHGPGKAAMEAARELLNA